MSERLTPYPSYRPMEHPWLGRTPNHWTLAPNRTLFEEVKVRNRPEAPMLSVTIARGVIRQSTLLENSSKKDGSNADKSKYKFVQPGDIAYNKMRAWQGAVGVSEFEGIVSPAYVVVRPRRRLNARYYHYLLRTPGFAKEAERWSYGITSDQWSLRPQHFKCIYCVVPPPDEQAAIVKFLGHANGRIRRYIQAKLKLIKLLEEQKQAIIHRAVTRGLDPNVKLKPSGVEWLGDVPEHWKCAALGRFLRRIEQGWSPISAEGEIDDDQWVVTSLSAVSRGHFNSGAIKPIRRSETIPTQLELIEGDLLMTRSNTRDRVGDVCIVEGARSRTIFSDLIYRLKLTGKVMPQFTAYVLLSRSSRIQIEMSARGSSGTMPKLAHRHIRSLRIAVPPQDEQTKIVRHIAENSKVFDDATRQARREIELLREYQTRLTADVVTGKLDVREAASKLPDAIVEQEAIDANIDDEGVGIEDEDEGMES